MAEMTNDTAVMNGPIQQPGSKACIQCRKVKMKCRPVAGTATCERCTRKSMDCVFFQKKRGRKPKRHRIADQASQTPGEENPATQTLQSETHDNFELPERNDSFSPITPAVHSSPLNQNNDLDSDFWESSAGLQPSCLLNKQASKGKYSLENILSAGQIVDAVDLQHVGTQVDDDPINNGLLSYHIAASLFEGFMKSLNAFVCILDPALHTFSYVREKSSFLLTVVLAAAARAFNPSLHTELHKHSQKLFLDSFARNLKSTEVIQAIILSTYWKQPDDTRSWSTIGYCIRLCMELNWHKLPAARDEDMRAGLDLEQRQQRDVERTWFVLFVYDRSMSLQTGKPWMIERSDFIESVNTWYRSPLATSNDATTAALVTLRLASADILEVFSPQRPVPPMAHPYRVDALLKTLSAQIEAWKRHWTNVISEKEVCNSFLVHFFGTHLSLLLYSFRLQASISSPIGASLVDTEAFWITYTSALEMLKLVSQPSLSPLLSFVHDSVHVMTAYAAVFLIKLLLSVNTAIRQEFEVNVIETIEVAAGVFAQQSMPPKFSCTLQARFLKNVIYEYHEASRRRLMRIIGGNPNGGASFRVTHRELANASLEKSREVLSASSSNLDHLHDGSSQMMLQLRLEHGLSKKYSKQPRQTRCTGNHTTFLQSPAPESLFTMKDIGSAGNEANEEQLHYEPSTDDHEWAALFLNAGFDIDGGVFVPQ